jgi:hypothetical protein
LVGALVFITGGESAADLHFELGLELHFLVQRADDLLGVQNLALVRALDVTGCDDALLVDCELQSAGLVVVGFEFDFFKIENDVHDIFNYSGKGAEFVLNAFDFNGGDGSAFERAEKDAAQGVSDSVPVTGLERLGNKKSIFICG